jgi:DNA primase
MTNWERVQARYPSLTKDMGMVKCAAHDDSHESLSVKRKGDDVLTHCFAGCDWKSVRDALGLTFTPQPQGDTAQRPTLPQKRLEGTYAYHNSAGDVVAEKRRYRMPDGTKQFVWSSLDATGTMRVGFSEGQSQGTLNLYGVLVAVQGACLGHPVFVVEGEKCVDLLDSIGVFSVTNPEGASGAASAYVGWRYDLFPPNTTFVILPDHDAPGAKHADKLAQALGPRFSTLTLTLPHLGPKDDVADYIARERAQAVPDATIARELHRLAVHAVPWTPPPTSTDSPCADVLEAREERAGIMQANGWTRADAERVAAHRVAQAEARHALTLSPAMRLYLGCTDPELRGIYRMMAFA